ncbi:MAG: IS66 family insertion sequence element accessory protein TnpB [Vulcanimicrobiota bacterium]
MLQLTPHMRILVAIEPVDGRKGIDSLAALCRQKLLEDPFSGAVFLFINRRRTAVRVLCYDGGGYWLAQKRLSKGRYGWWPTSNSPSQSLEPHQVHALLAAAASPTIPNARVWRPITPAGRN